MKYKYFTHYFFSVIICCSLTLFTIACAKKVHINTYYISVTENVPVNNDIELFLKPYRDHITADLSKILAYNPVNLDKSSSKWQNPMTNFFADAILETARPVFEKRTGKQIDFCLLNYGGIRSTIAKGNITTKTAYNIMPFENSAVVLTLTGETVYEVAAFIATNKVAHPLSGIEIYLDKENHLVKDIKINGVHVKKNQFYNVITNDYLAKGGDKMDFFAKAVNSYPLDYKLRNMFIAYFNKIDTLKPSVQPRILFEQ